MSFLKKIASFWRVPEGTDRAHLEQYRRLWKHVVLVTIVLSLIPIIILLAANYLQFNRALRREKSLQILNTSLTIKQPLEEYLHKRKNALYLSANAHPISMTDSVVRLSRLFETIKNSFSDLAAIGIYDKTGQLLEQAGKHVLSEQWPQSKFNQETELDMFMVQKIISDNKNLYIAMPIRQQNDSYLVSLFDMEPFADLLPPGDKKHDMFLINRDGVLQTDSLLFGPAMSTFPISLTKMTQIHEGVKEITTGQQRYSVSSITGSPFFLVVSKPLLNQWQVFANWISIDNKPLVFFLISMIFGFLAIMASAAYLVSLIRDADIQRAAVLQNVELEHINKLASIGRLAAGVAHEINNPLAIINQKAGLMEDIIMLSDDLPHKHEFEQVIAAIHNSVDRCSTITHRLLGFARHMDVYIETVDLNKIIKDVFSFLEKEAIHRNISVELQLDEKPALIDSDKGQLEQVFLNIINNAFDAVDEGGSIYISVAEKWEALNSNNEMKFYSDSYEVTVSDNGMGIMEKNLKHIFEPFFTTKTEHGTGLGLAITYGIVKKLGGTIHVDSHVGKGTIFVITLPKKKVIQGGKNGENESSSGG